VRHVAIAIASLLFHGSAIANPIVRDMLNNADLGFSIGRKDIACMSVQLAIANSKGATAAQRVEISQYAKRCNLRQ
jgi:hypothetical protein